MVEVWKLVAKCYLLGRHPREIWGAIDDISAGTNVSPKEHFLADSNQVEAFFLMTKVDPICLLAVLSTTELIPL